MDNRSRVGGEKLRLRNLSGAIGPAGQNIHAIGDDDIGAPLLTGAKRSDGKTAPGKRTTECQVVLRVQRPMVAPAPQVRITPPGQQKAFQRPLLFHMPKA